MRHLIAGLVTLYFFSPSISLAQSTIKIIDGDTIEAEGKRMRIYGIDAPETHQKCQYLDKREYECGVVSTEILMEIVGIEDRAGTVQSLDCTGIDKDRYGRWVSVCFVNGVNIGREMVKRGAALAYKQYSHAYVEEELAAQNTQIGVWQGTFELPWIWRRNQKQPH